MITYDFTEQGIEQALTALGTTPNAVATNLSAMGFRGCRNEESSCPIAHYLTDAVPGIWSVGVWSEQIDSNGVRSTTGHIEYNAGDPSTSDVAEMPQPVAAFVIAFDLGDYPDLIEGAVNA